MTKASEELQKALAEQKALDEKIKELKSKSKEEDLETVKSLCKLHGFTATNLRGCLKTKGSGKTEGTKKKPAAKKKAS